MLQVRCFEMSSVQKVLSRIPLVIVLGPTGSGKTKLSLDIASKFAGEILSADAMQVIKISLNYLRLC